MSLVYFDFNINIISSLWCIRFSPFCVRDPGNSERQATFTRRDWKRVNTYKKRIHKVVDSTRLGTGKLLVGRNGGKGHCSFHKVGKPFDICVSWYNPQLHRTKTDSFGRRHFVPITLSSTVSINVLHTSSVGHSVSRTLAVLQGNSRVFTITNPTGVVRDREIIPDLTVTDSFSFCSI